MRRTMLRGWRSGGLILLMMFACASAGATSRPGRRRNGIYVNLKQHRLYEYHHGKLKGRFRISSGTGRPSKKAKHTQTPRGNFRVLRKKPGWVKSPLGKLYYPLYFDRGGDAIHGGSVRRAESSHGCIHIPLKAAKAFYQRNPVGTRVYIR
jgi:lipoprotein-anchoring transpeptidase ErfK/SrfK